MSEQPPGGPYRGDGGPGDPGPGGPGPGPARPATPRNGFGTAALVLGLLSLLLFLIGPLAIVLGVIAIVLGVLGRGRVRDGIATNGGAALAGIVLGALGLLLGAVITFTVGAFFVEFGDEIRDSADCVEQNAGDQEAIDACIEDLQRQIEQQEQR
jgi:hypothetical protein